jgi:uncharacterized membrane protein HdeD (DUF308 family)
MGGGIIVSDLSMPDTTAGAVSRDVVRGLARNWWLFLVIGVLWILFGMFVLSYNVGSLLALAVLAGVTFIAFDLRGLDHRLDRGAPGQPPG